jgi:hypothetical protein
MSTPKTDFRFFKVTFQVLAKVDRSQRLILQIVGHIEPDHARTSRARYVQAAMQRETPPAWRN